MRRRGFTLIEVVVVCAILSTLAALVYPNVVAMKLNRERQEAYGDVLRLAQMGRMASIDDGGTYTLSVEGGTKVVLEREAPPKTSGGSSSSSSTTSQAPPPALPKGILIGSEGPSSSKVGSGAGGSDEVVGDSVSLPDGVNVGDATLDGKASTSADFKLHFYPDGRSEGGGFEMVDRSTTRVLTVDRNGLAKLEEGKLPAATANTWEAGQYEQRASG